jgi:hypothetical protein
MSELTDDLLKIPRAFEFYNPRAAARSNLFGHALSPGRTAGCGLISGWPPRIVRAPFSYSHTSVANCAGGELKRLAAHESASPRQWINLFPIS